MSTFPSRILHRSKDKEICKSRNTTHAIIALIELEPPKSFPRGCEEGREVGVQFGSLRRPFLLFRDKPSFLKTHPELFTTIDVLLRSGIVYDRRGVGKGRTKAKSTGSSKKSVGSSICLRSKSSCFHSHCSSLRYCC